MRYVLLCFFAFLVASDSVSSQEKYSDGVGCFEPDRGRAQVASEIYAYAILQRMGGGTPNIQSLDRFLFDDGSRSEVVLKMRARVHRAYDLMSAGKKHDLEKDLRIILREFNELAASMKKNKKLAELPNLFKSMEAVFIGALYGIVSLPKPNYDDFFKLDEKYQIVANFVEGYDAPCFDRTGIVMKRIIELVQRR